MCKIYPEIRLFSVLYVDVNAPSAIQKKGGKNNPEQLTNWFK